MAAELSRRRVMVCCLEFPSVVDAVTLRCGHSASMAERNAGVSPEQRIEFRIGINVGDIIIDGDDIFGDGVNVAARLRRWPSRAESAQSRGARSGARQVKFHIRGARSAGGQEHCRPVEVYRVDLGSEALQKPSGGRRRWQRLTQSPRWRWLGVGTVVLLIGGTTAWYVQSSRTTPPQAGASVPPAFSIAILPLHRLGPLGRTS